MDGYPVKNQRLGEMEFENQSKIRYFRKRGLKIQTNAKMMAG